MFRHCFLRCLADSHSAIPLPDGVEIVVGRSKATKIQDQNCSRQQISLKANYEDFTVELKQLGVNPSGLDGFSMNRGSIYNIGHGSFVEILLDQYPHIVDFEPPPSDEELPGMKRKLYEDEPRTAKMPKLDEPSTSKSLDTPTTEKVWEDIDKGELYIFTAKGVKSSSKIAAYDMDGTIIKTRSGRTFPVDIMDWQIAHSEIHSKFKKLNNDGYKIVFLTNQGPIGKGRVKIEDFKKKVEAIVEKLDVPIQVYLATGSGMYRKPMTGMWDVLVEEKNNNLPIDRELSFFCGDAAGRLVNWAPGKKKDHSIADRLLAQNIELTFYTPEEHFLGHPHNKVPYKMPDFIPKDMIESPFKDELICTEQEILVMVGFPGSGKSFLAKQLDSRSSGRYQAVCRDVLGSFNRCASEAKKLLGNGKSVVVDSTNPDLESRERWVALAKELKVQSRCAVMKVNLTHARHNNKFRELLKIKHMQVADIVFHSYNKKFQEPSTKEGFKEVLSVPFSPSFDSEESKKLYYMHLLEK